jgi:hypothetical protein
MHSKKVNKVIFKLANFDIKEARHEFKLGLRKEKLDDLILRKREEAMSKYQEKAIYEVDPNSLSLPDNVKSKNCGSFVI